jgi:hypothetical protein
MTATWLPFCRYLRGLAGKDQLTELAQRRLVMNSGSHVTPIVSQDGRFNVIRQHSNFPAFAQELVTS